MTYPIFYNNRGDLKNINDDRLGAIEDFDKAIELDSLYGIAYVNRAFSKKLIHDFNGAILDYDKAISIDPLNPIFYYDRAETRMEMGDAAGACIDWLISRDLGFDIPEYHDLIDSYCDSNLNYNSN